MAVKSKSQRMRELAAAGMSRADIARKLGVRYQFVRNVLERERARKAEAQAPRGFAEPAQARLAETRRAKVRLGPDGRIVIPAAFRQALGLEHGDRLMVRLADNELRIYSYAEAMRRAQAMVRRFVPKGVSLVDELIAERRREAAKERNA